MGEAILKIKQMRDSSWFWWIVLLPLVFLVIWVLWQMDADARRMRDLANQLEEERRRRKRLEEEAKQAAMKAEQDALRAQVDASTKRIKARQSELDAEVKKNEATVEAIRNIPDSDTAAIIAAYEDARKALAAAQSEADNA